jgi:hypothetical protein
MAKAMNMMKVSIEPVMMLVTSGPKLACLTRQAWVKFS